MALTHWTFLYAAAGLPDRGELREVATGSSTTVLVGFPTADAALAACLPDGSLAEVLDATELLELCGAFGHDHVAALRAARPHLPIGLVTYAGDATGQLHALFG